MRLASLERLRVEGFSIGMMADLLASAGIDAEPALERCGLTREELNRPSFSASGHQEMRFQQEFVALTWERRDLWEKLALRYRLPSISPWGFALTTAPTLRRLFDLVVEFNDISYSLVKARTFADGDATNGIQLDFSEMPDDLREFTMYRDTLGFTNVLHDDVWRGVFPLVRIETELTKEQTRGFDFRAPVTYGAKRTAWLWPAYLAETPPASADPALHDTYLRKARASLLDVAPGDPLIARIGAVLGEGGEGMSLAQLAERLRMTERALQRRLSRSGTTLRALVNDHRRQAAERLLTQTPDAIGEIAIKLGYSDQATFNHAFKRWTGLNPSEFRRHYWTRSGQV